MLNFILKYLYLVKYICVILWILSIPITPAICDYYFRYGEWVDSFGWWMYYKDLVTLFNMIAAFGFLNFVNENKYGKFLGAVLLGFSITDFIEKWILHDRTKFCTADLIGILAVVFLTYFEQIAHPVLMKNWAYYNKIVTKINGTKFTKSK